MNRKKIGDLTSTEWQLIRIVWDNEPATARMIHDEILKERKTTYSVTSITLDRMVDKGFLKREKFGPVWVFTSQVAEGKMKKKAIEDFIHTVLGDTIAPIFIHAAKNKKFVDEYNTFKKMIEDIDDEE